MIRHQIIIVLSIAALVGCQSKSKSTRVPETSTPSEKVVSTDDRISDLERYSVELSAVTKNLPGRDATEDRQLLGDAFDRASSTLTLLMGPEPNGAFRQQLHVIDNVRQDIRAGRAVDATVDSGLRAVFNALVGVRERLFPTDERVNGDLNQLRDKVLDLDAVRGPLHSVAVASAFQSAATSIETMRAELQNRFAAAGPTTQPTQ
jgi:hypothetical protein